MAFSKIPSAGFQDNVKFRNIIINGDMSIAQRSTTDSLVTTSGYKTVDRWKLDITTQGTWTQSQSTDVPSGQGFVKSLKMDCTTADASPASDDRVMIRQFIEGQNVQYLKKGTSNAESLTCSFWVKSNKTGTYIVEIYDLDNSRHINKSYTINSASTWEKKTITFAGDTTGAFDNDNAVSLQLGFWLGAGSNYTSGTLQTSWGADAKANRAVGQVNLADSTSNEWYITGVQLEAGQTASEFEFLPRQVTENLCFRYFYKNIGHGSIVADTFINDTSDDGTKRLFIQYPQIMRAIPSLSGTGSSSVNFQYTGNASAIAYMFQSTGALINSYTLNAEL